MSDRIGKTITCKAAVTLAKNSTPICSIETVEVATPSAGQVRIKIEACGVCHSDLSVHNGVLPQPFPIVLGHEAAGIVESIGEGVTRVVPGDKVIYLFVPYCGKCHVCTNPETNAGCKNVSASVMSWNGKLPTNDKFGCFAEYTLVSEERVMKVNKNAPLDKVCLFGCALATGYGSTVKTARVKPESTCAVWGLGAVGLAAVFGCKKSGARRIIVVDINPDKAEKAKLLGATDFINPKDHEEPIEDVIKKMTGGGCDFTFECAGICSTAEAAIKASHPNWGVCTLIGIPPADKALQIYPLEIISGRTIKGSVFGGFKGCEIPELVEMYMNGEFPIEEFITHTMSLGEINVAFDLLQRGKSIRTVLLMSEK